MIKIKKIGLLFVSILIIFKAYAGNSKKEGTKPHSELKTGIDVGINFPKIIFSQNIFHTSTLFALAWHVGGYVTLDLSDKYTFQPELLYSVKGYREPNSFGGSNNYLTYRYNYIEVPVQIKDKIGKQFALSGGLDFGFLTKVTSNYANTIVGNSNPYNNTVNYNKLDIGVIIGLYYQWANGFNLAVKESQGFIDIVPAYNSNGSSLLPEYNMVISVCAGWTFK